MKQRCESRVTRLLHRPLSADAAVQIALLNNLGLKPPITGSASPRRSPSRRAGRRLRPSTFSDRVDHRSSSTSSGRSSAACCRSSPCRRARSIAADEFAAAELARRGGDLAGRGRDAARLSASGRRPADRCGARRGQGKRRGLGRARGRAQAHRRREQRSTRRAARSSPPRWTQSLSARSNRLRLHARGSRG